MYSSIIQREKLYGSFKKANEISLDEPKYFWKSQSYDKSYFTKKYETGKFRFYDSSSFIKFLFFNWVTKWSVFLSKNYFEPYKLHPLPVSDQILYWQPIFSKHLSDGLARLEFYQALASKSDQRQKKQSYKLMLARALFLTFWKRILFIFVSIVITNLLSMSIAFLVKKVLEKLNVKTIRYTKILFMLTAIIILQIFNGLLSDNFAFYAYRLINVIQYSFSITMFQHGLCYRRKYFNNIEGSNSLNVCNNVLHSFSPDSECSKNPLFCPARRYQNRDMTPQIFTLEFVDSYLVSWFVESIVFVVEFLSNFIYGIILISIQVKVSLWVLYVIGSIFIFLMVVVEVCNSYVLQSILNRRDHRIAKSNSIIPFLPLINKMLHDDIAINIITLSRNNELKLIVVRIFLTLFNTFLYTVYINVSFYVLKSYFVKSVNDASVITEIDTAGFLTTFYVFVKIIDSMNMIPLSIKNITVTFVSFKRFNNFVKKTSPNYFVCDNNFIGTSHMSSNINDITNQINKDVVVLYKDASFSWVHSTTEVLDLTCQPYLKNINFELKRGETVIITGPNGSGKSNFIKSVLGEMTLVDGSMAVVPLHTSMPIFYASQDIWLQQGTIRSNITFGYRFDKDIYNTVLRAVELEFDISTWEKGDLRVVSDNGYSLSGGQRVRTEIARAIYAYMIFSKVNREYNNSRCSFLMCLDTPFHALDPFVSKLLFNNLFNVKTGILVVDDLSVILSCSKRSLDKCLTPSSLGRLSNIPLYSIKDGTLSFYCYLHDLIRLHYDKLLPSKHISSPSNRPYCMNLFTSDMISLCLSGSNSRVGRRVVTKSKYDYSFKSYVQNESTGIRYNPYAVYFTPALTTFLIFIFLTVVYIIMDNVKFVVATNLSDYISKNINDYNDGNWIDLSEIKSHSNKSKDIVLILVVLTILVCIMSVLFFSYSCLITSRKIHEYSLDSIFKNSSTVVKIKKQLCQVMTYICCDLFMIDDDLSYSISATVIGLVNTLITVSTLFYLIPISMPFVSLSLFLIYKFLFLKYIRSSKNLRLMYIETNTHINGVCENAISGSSIYRSFKKEWELMHNIVEHTDYHVRCKFLSRAIRTWSSVIANWIFSLTTLVILVVLIMFDRFTKYKLKVGHFGLGLSLSMKALKLFTKLSINIARLEMAICSVERFEYFIPPGTKFKFGKSINIHEENVLTNYTPGNVYKIDKKELLKRRSVEFGRENPKYQSIKRLFYKPKINLLDVTKYLTPEHLGIELHNVFVYNSNAINEKCGILKNITVSAHRSDIIGIIGRTGAGKTTLLSVLENTKKHRTGHVLLDGRELNDIPKNVTRQIIGVLPQLPFVFKDWTIRRFIDPRRLFSDDEINKALDMCGLLEFVNNLQGGNKLDSVIIPDEIQMIGQKSMGTDHNKNFKSERSEMSALTENLKSYYAESDLLLSNSQLRTLWFAKLVLYRYFYRIIVIDEPPSENCSGTTNFEVQDVGFPIYELLEKYFKHCTCFVTAHDVNVLRMCTSVWVVHNGRLIKTCKADAISADETVSDVIEQIVKDYSSYKQE